MTTALVAPDPDGYVTFHRAWLGLHQWARETDAIMAAQALADETDCGAGVWHRDGWYVVCDIPPDMIEPSPEAFGWTFYALLGPTERES